jgi:hypothetical protein
MSKSKIAFWLIVLLIVAGILWKTGVVEGLASKDTYKAIFLTNGQVYFGKVLNERGQFVKVRDIFYLQVRQTIQPIEGVGQQGQNLDLIKLGQEVHQPTDEMRVNRDQILFIENLRPDSQIVTSIAQFKEQQAGGN